MVPLTGDSLQCFDVMNLIPSRYSVLVELRHLRYFVAVGEEEHFGRAAERLHVVQPALTRQVRQLEEELGCALFERLKWGVRLTEAGKSFLEQAKRLLSDLGRGVDRTRLVAQGKVGRLRVGFSETATHGGELPSILRHFRASWPDVQLELFPGTSLSAGEQLRNREVDVALVYIPPTTLRELGSHTISVERIVLALPRAHPLVKRKRLRLGDLRDESFVWFPRTANSHVYDRVLSACHTAGVALKIVQEVNSDTTGLSLVAGGIGLSFVIESAKRTRPNGVVLRELEDLRVTAQLFAIWRKDNKAPALQTFVEMIRGRFAEVARH
jgi:DNA-binding transcriptional LysR family regulator